MIKIAVISASLGGFDKPADHEPQSVAFDYFLFTDENFPARSKAMTPRLQAKIPKCFGWQLKPGYDFYLWLDGEFRFKQPDSLKYFLDNCQEHDICTLRHYRRPNIRQEFRYTRNGIRQSPYMQNRYNGELLAEQYAVIEADKDYADDTLLLGSVFMYRNSHQVQSALKEWWYHISRYTVADQLAFPYVLKKAKLKINILPYDDKPSWYLESQKHNSRN
ncbi:MAG: hypothetical protein G01um101416_694 [Microgenomates group bacterium Gr01-1014_16]|nr:MAG: hypothetical protein G01um101416_694 [Microgenomates group bacterium Gr01-1014_16]